MFFLPSKCPNILNTCLKIEKPTISRDVEDAKADEIFTPVEEEDTQVANGSPIEPSAAIPTAEAPVEESDQDVDPFPGE